MTKAERILSEKLAACGDVSQLKTKVEIEL